MSDLLIKDIHQRIVRVEDKLDRLVTLEERVKWLKRFILLAWAAILSILGFRA